MEILLGVILAILIFSILMLYQSFAWGYVASVLYSWFVTSYFTEAPILYWWHFAGFMFIANCFIHSDTHHFKDEIKDKTTGAVSSIIAPWVLLFAAWVFKIIIL